MILSNLSSLFLLINILFLSYFIYQFLHSRITPRSIEEIVPSTGSDQNQIILIEEKLRQGEERFRLIFEEGPLGMVIINPNYGYERVNKCFCDMLGYTEEELITKTFADITHPEDREIDLDLAEKVFKGEIPSYQIEKRYIKKGGEIRWGSMIASVIFNDSGLPVYGLAMIEDITERKFATEALQKSRENLHITLNSIADAVISIDENEKINRMNPVAEELTGWSMERALGLPFDEVVQLEYTQPTLQLESVLGGSYQAASESDNQIVLIAKNGMRYDVAESSAPIQDAENNIIGSVFVFKNITEKLKIEEELLKAQKLESLSLLAGGIAHDFNNLLTGLYGNIQMAKFYPSSEKKAQTYLNRAIGSMEQAISLSEQLMTFSRGGEPAKQNLSLSEMLLETAQFSLRGSKIELQTCINPDLMPVKADKGQMSQVITNLVINAQQAMPKGGVLKVWADNLIDRRLVKITIIDEGVGISPENLNKIFDPYFTTKQTGNGLGLASTYSIIKNHNGEILVNSVLNQGTTFDIYLPMSESDTDLENQQSKRPIDAKISPAQILVLEDNGDVRQALGAMLEKMGHKVCYTTHGAEAISKYKRRFANDKEYDLCITDLTISGSEGGLEIAQEILYINPQAKIIVSSGYSNDPVLENYNLYGFKGTIKKPYTFRELRDEIRHVLFN